MHNATTQRDPAPQVLVNAGDIVPYRDTQKGCAWSFTFDDHSSTVNTSKSPMKWSKDPVTAWEILQNPVYGVSFVVCSCWDSLIINKRCSSNIKLYICVPERSAVIKNSTFLRFDHPGGAAEQDNFYPPRYSPCQLKHLPITLVYTGKLINKSSKCVKNNRYHPTRQQSPLRR
jgi:hypothetical protein